MIPEIPAAAIVTKLTSTIPQDTGIYEIIEDQIKVKNFRYLKGIYNGIKDKKIQFENYPSQLREKYAEVVNKICLLFSNKLYS